MSRARTSQPLAIEGGTPVRRTLLEFSPPVIGRAEIDAVVKTLESGWLTSGPRVLELEERFAEYAGAEHAIATSSCTDALHLALRVAGVGAGDEVITSSFTWPATVNAILHTGATPRFADIDPGTLNLDPALVEAAVTPRTRAVLPVHFAGGPCDMDAIELAVKDRGIAIVEDAAHAVESTVRGRKVGAIGDLTCFSLYATKSLAGGEGGIVTTNSAEMAKRLRLLRSHGITRDPWRRAQTRTLGHYDVVEPGWKANLADLQAAAALPKVGRIDEFRAHRADLVERYDAGLAPLQGIEPIGRPGFGVHSHHLYVVRVDPALAGGDRDAYAAALMGEHIATGLHFLPVHRLTWYRDHLDPVPLPETERAGAEVLSLPLAAAHSEADIDDAVAAVRKVHAAYADAGS
jgi:dTDP-4-amino-4,6-dideoxygalactose transaminase